MIGELRLRVLQQWRLLIPVTVLAVVLSPHTQVHVQAADGDLDPTFGDAGKVTIDFIYNDAGSDISTSDEAQAVAIQPDGKIVTAGAAPLNILIALPVGRTNPDGSPDLTFGSRGQVLSDWIRYQQASSVVVQPDGKIVIGGWGGGWPDNFLLVRYNSDGPLDTSFGDNGLVQTGLGDDPNDLQAVRSDVAALALQADGKIVAAGTRGSTAGSPRSFALARYNPDGSLDPTFGGDGRVVTTIGSNPARVADVALQPDGRIVVAGYSADNFRLARYNPDGSLDTTFSGNGIVGTDFGGEDVAHGVAVQADGRIVAAGTTITADGGTDFALARYNADGTLDATFGAGGMVTTDFGGTDDDGRDMALQADGKIVVAGSSSLDGGPTASDIAVARYEADGTLDPTFGAGGLVTTDIAGSFDGGNAVAIQADGKIVVAGSTWSEGSTPDFVIVRYEGAPPHPLTFFLHGSDLPGTAGGFTMNPTAPAPQVLRSHARRRTWFSDPVVNGTFLTGSTFEVTLPCTHGISLPKTVHIGSTDADGGGEQPLGEAAVDFEICRSQTIAVPVATPIGLAERRLKLTLTSELPISLPLRLGPETFLRATTFAGVP